MTTQATAAPQALSTLSEEETMFREAVRDFAESEVKPHVHEMDEAAKFRPEIIEKFFEMGLMGIEVPEALGGAGGTIFMATLAIEELARVDASAAIYVDVHNTLVNNAMLRWGSEEQKRVLFPRMTTGLLGAFALSEPDSGSDAFALQCRADDKGDHWELTGRKFWITNGAEAGIFIVFANTDFSKGYKIAIETLNEGRIGIGAQMIGVGSGALAAATQYVKERRQFGKAIAEFQGIQFQLAQMATDLEAARLMVYNTARLKDSGQPFVQEAAMAKLFSSQVADRVSSQCLELFGGYGYSREYPAEKFYRDAKIGTIYEGTSNMQLNTIAKTLLK